METLYHYVVSYLSLMKQLHLCKLRRDCGLYVDDDRSTAMCRSDISTIVKVHQREVVIADFLITTIEKVHQYEGMKVVYQSSVTEVHPCTFVLAGYLSEMIAVHQCEGVIVSSRTSNDNST